LEFQNVVLASCVVGGYNETLTTCRIDISTQCKTIVSRDVNSDADVRSSSSQVSHSKIQGSLEVVVSKANPEVKANSDSGVDKVTLEMDIPSPTKPTLRKSRWLTQTSQDAHEYVGAPKSSMTVSMPPGRNANHVVLASSTSDTSNYCDQCSTRTRPLCFPYIWDKGMPREVIPPHPPFG